MTIENTPNLSNLDDTPGMPSASVIAPHLLYPEYPPGTFGRNLMLEKQQVEQVESDSNGGPFATITDVIFEGLAFEKPSPDNRVAPFALSDEELVYLHDEGPKPETTD